MASHPICSTGQRPRASDPWSEQRTQLADLVADDGVDRADRPRGLAQDGIAVLAHARQRRLPALELLAGRLVGRRHGARVYESRTVGPDPPWLWYNS